VFYGKVLNTNSKGLRVKKDFQYSKKTKAQKGYFILGDSFTFGDEVSDNQTYASYLQEMLPNIEVINAGVHGYGHDQMLLLLKEEGVKYEPDIVIIGFLPFDMPRNLLEFRDFAKPRFILKNGELRLTGSPVPRPEDILARDWMRPRIIDVFTLIRSKAKGFLGLRKKEMDAVTAALLREMVHVINSIHAVPVLVYLPAGREMYLSDSVVPYEKFMYSICQEDKNAKCFSVGSFFLEKIADGVKFKSFTSGKAGGLICEPLKAA